MESMLFITHFPFITEGKNSFEKEDDLKKELENNELKFFHSKFQTMEGTLNRFITRSERAHIVFDKNVPDKKVKKIIEFVLEKKGEDCVTFSSFTN